MKLSKILIICVSLFFISCSSEQKGVLEKTNGLVQTDIKPTILFDSEITKNNNNPIVASGEIRVNDNYFIGSYVFSNGNRMTLLPDEPFSGNKKYEIKIDSSLINKNSDSNINIKNLKMNFETKPLEAQFQDISFIRDTQFLDKIKLEAKLELSQNIPLDDIKENLKLLDSNKNSIELSINRDLNQLNTYYIHSMLLDSPKQKDEAYNLVLSKDIGLQKEISQEILAPKNLSLDIVSSKVINGDKISIEIKFSETLGYNINLDNFIRISPNVKFSVSQIDNIINIMGNFAQDSDYVVEILRGIKSQNSKLEKDVKIDIKTYDIAPKIQFSNDGIFLPDVNHKKIAFRSINVKKANVVVKKVYTNNITQFLNKSSLIKNNSYNYWLYDFGYIGDTIKEMSIDIDSPKNIWVQNELDLSFINDISGIFIVSLHFDQDGVDYKFPAGTAQWKQNNYFYENGSVYKQLVFSNMALIAQSFYDGDRYRIIASAIDIRDNKPLSGVNIQSISIKNQIISNGVTDKDGNLILDYYGGENTKDLKPMYLSGSKDDNFAILHLDSMKLNLDGFDVGGGVDDSGNVKAFIYTDRGVYRPGDTAYLNIVARNGMSNIQHPIKLTITTPRNKKQINELSLSPIQNGIYYYEFMTDKNADTGTYNISVDIGGNIFNHKIAFETIVPNRIKVDIDAVNEIDLKKEKNIKFGIQSDYLFGAPASNLEYNIDVAIRPKDFISKNYKDYVFENKTNLRYQDNRNYSGILNSDGFASGNIDIKNINKIDKNLEALLIARVFENNGRQVNNRKIVDLKFFDSFVGIKKPSSRYIKQDDNVNLSVILIDENEKPIANRKLKYKVYNNNYSWWLDYNSYERYALSIKSDKNTKIVNEGEIITNNKVNNISFKVKDRGEILVEVIDTTNNQSASIFLYSSSWGEPLDIDKITQLQIKTDKKEYVHNDTAKVIFESVKGGKALITISDSNNILDRYWIDTKSNQSIIDIKIDEKYSPNLYASVLLLQDYQNNDNDRSLRLYGVVPINIINNKTKLDIDLKAPNEILPNSNLHIEVSNRQNKQVTYTIALVDEGLLGLTNFKTPSPWDYFYAKMKYNIDTFDTYGYVVNKATGKIEKIYSIGGDVFHSYAESARGNRQKDDSAERFKPVAFFVKPVQSDKQGKADFEFKLPSYLGSLRAMVVAIDENNFGSVDKNIRVNAPVVMLPTIPRSLKINDYFKIPVEIMPIKDGVKNATISIESNGIITFDKKSYDLSFEDKKSKIVFFEGRVREELGIEDIVITLKSGDFSMLDSTNIDIKAPNPYTTIIDNFIIDNDNKIVRIDTPSSFVNKSNIGKITISNTPILSIDHRLLWLIRYPYGCIEQTTSSIFPQLFIDKLSSADFIDKQTMIDNINAGIAKIALFQTSDGGFSYWKGQGNSNFWGSNYASHFLFMAKKQGFAVSDDMLNRVLNYQIKNARNKYNDMYPLYLLALSDNTQLGIMNEIYENNLNSLSIVNKWLLAASYKLAGFDDIATKISLNLSTKPNDSSNYYDYSYGSSLRSKAMILQAYKIINNEIHKDLYNDIKNALESDEWLSTQTISYALLVLADIKEDAKNSNIEGTITINNKKQSFNTDSSNIVFSLNDGVAKVESNKNLFINYIWEGIIANNAGDNISKKLKLKREFVEIDNYGNEIQIDPRNLKSSNSFYIKLTLEKLDSSNKNYLENIALVQNLPSGWEIENTRLNNDPLLDKVAKANSTITYTDIRDDKIMWFFNLYNKPQVVYVKINAVTPGNYTLPSAYAEAMYDGSYQASSDSFRVNVLSK
ncbi:MAG: alpha-2-macroglobulin family protein [Helicobacteraceae bacterium]|nr:alpha-2-macroglobulin family protein [Helicobacteraceae bacterium]